MAKYKLTIVDKDEVLINTIPAQPEEGFEEGTKVTINVKYGPVGNLFGSIDGGTPTVIIPKAVFEVTMDTDKTVTLTKQSESSGVATPAITPNGGAVEAGSTVEITCATEDAEIFYTTDGSTPTAESTKYTEAIEVTGAVTIKAIAIKDELSSNVVSASFTIAVPEAETPTIDTDLNATAEIPVGEPSIDLTIVASVTDGGTLSYAWTKDGEDASGSDAATLTVTEAGVYQCTVTNTLGEDTATAQSTACTVTQGE